jgi:hypothetical protein
VLLSALEFVASLLILIFNSTQLPVMPKILSAVLLIFLFSCNSKNTETTVNTDSTGSKLFIPSYAVKNFEGTYSGNFDQGYITIVLNYVNGKNVSGYNLHKGTRRNINGTLKADSGVYKFILKEPGDNPFDGTFEFSIDTTKFSVSGIWTPNDASKTSSKTLSLTKQPKKNLDVIEDQLGTWVPATGTYNTDTTLEFAAEGTCEYKFYATPGDSTSQVNSVKGNYVVVKDSILIEWQKNAFTPSQKMKLVKKVKKVKANGDTYDELQLSGNGWKFVQFQGD